jgi:hypothetical protein
LNLSGASAPRAQASREEEPIGSQPSTGRDLVAAQTPKGAAWVPEADPSRRQLEAAWLALARELMARTEDVGSAFAEEARRIHHGEAPERGIRGQATREETLELLEEGVPVLPLPLPAALKGTVH